MEREFGTDGTVIPMTAIDASSCVVTQVRTHASGSIEVQLGAHKATRIGKSRAGHLKDMPLVRTLRSFQFKNKPAEGFERGKAIPVSVFAIGDKVAVTGVSIGKGFAGVMKRHGFHGHPATHGHKDSHRAPGSIGAGGVQRVLKGMRMAGRMGGDRVTVKNLEVIKINEEKGIIYLKGAIPGARNGVVMIKSK